jgi:hypothetical protein
MPLKELPLEIRSIIFQMLDDFSLAKDINEVFWALAPQYFRNLTIGDKYYNQKENLETDLVKKFPTSGKYVERLTIHPESLNADTITDFLTLTLDFRKLTHLTLFYSRADNSYPLALELPYLDELEKVIKDSEVLAWLTFDDIQPWCSLIDAGEDRLRRLDFGYGFPSEAEIILTLPPRVEILTITPSTVSFLHGPCHNLTVLILKNDHSTCQQYAFYIRQIIKRSPFLMSLAVIDTSEYIS